MKKNILFLFFVTYTVLFQAASMSLDEAFIRLGVPLNSDLELVTKAYRGLAAKEHPDKNRSTPQATQRFQHLQTAYERLKDHFKSLDGIDIENELAKYAAEELAKAKRVEKIPENFEQEWFFEMPDHPVDFSSLDPEKKMEIELSLLSMCVKRQNLILTETYLTKLNSLGQKYQEYIRLILQTQRAISRDQKSNLGRDYIEDKKGILRKYIDELRCLHQQHEDLNKLKMLMALGKTINAEQFVEKEYLLTRYTTMLQQYGDTIKGIFDDNASRERTGVEPAPAPAQKYFFKRGVYLFVASGLLVAIFLKFKGDPQVPFGVPNYPNSFNSIIKRCKSFFANNQENQFNATVNQPAYPYFIIAGVAVTLLGLVYWYLNNNTKESDEQNEKDDEYNSDDIDLAVKNRK